MYIALSIILLLASAGWWVEHRRARRKRKQTTLPKDYFVGLNYLLLEQPDKAIDAFIRLMDLDTESLDIHFALGHLFRRRGEVDRAIRLHQNILSVENLSKDIRLQALLALGQDYLSAGVFDRAERLFRELLEIPNRFRVSALKGLQDIYEREKEWRNALEVTLQLTQLSEEAVEKNIAHYYCELIEDKRELISDEHRVEYLNLALSADENCVRANSLSANFFIQQGFFKEAINTYKHLLMVAPNFISEFLPNMEALYDQLGKSQEFIDLLKTTLLQHRSPYLIFTLTNKLLAHENLEAAKHFLESELQKIPSLLGVEQLTSLELLSASHHQGLSLINQFLKNMLYQSTGYRCHHCGFFSRKQLWLCPSCRHWESIAPISLNDN
jgi:lipopolysaccharide biosynthesis regulator YciM